MVQVSYPGVYIEEVPSGVHTVTNVSTSIAAFIDFFKEGPMNEAVQIFGMADFQRIFGGLDDRSEASYAISQFFLNGGSQAYVVRVAANSSPLAKATVTIKDSTLATDVLKVSAANEGKWGKNLRIDIDFNTEDATKYFNMYVTRYDSALADASPISQESFLQLSPDSTNQRYVKTIVNDESSLVQLDHLSSGSPTIFPAPGGTFGGDISSLTQGQLDTLGTATKKFNVKIGTITKAATLGTWAAGDVKTL